jgi:serine/threonine protein kinase
MLGFDCPKAICRPGEDGMQPPATVEEFLGIVRKSGLVEPFRLSAALEQFQTLPRQPDSAADMAKLMVRYGVLTKFQAEQLLGGKWRGFTLGKYTLLEWLGSGGMGYVYLAEHKFMRRLVALKVLPVALAQERWFLECFYREAQAVAALDHPNIVRAYDIDNEGNLHFLVMEYVDGSSLQKIVGRNGPMGPSRAAHYVRQAALALHHAHEIGMVHRDIKPANLLLDRRGVVKVLDMGLAYFARIKEAESLAARELIKRMVGTDDYLAPEQIMDSDAVDIRADIYALGCTFYFLLTRKSPFEDAGPSRQKLIGHMLWAPKSVREVRPDVADALVVVLEKMMAKNPWERYQTPAELVEALAPFTQTPIPPPPAAEMPKLSLAVRRFATPGKVSDSVVVPAPGGNSWVRPVVTLGTGSKSGSGSSVSGSGVRALADTAAQAREGTNASNPPIVDSAEESATTAGTE